MRNRLKIAAFATALAAVAMTAVSADARPRHHHYGHRHHHGGGGAVAGAVLGGLLLGGALAAQPRYYYDEPAYGYYRGGGAVEYCMQRFRSYDPASGTYLGYDGLRHPCP